MPEITDIEVEPESKPESPFVDTDAEFQINPDAEETEKPKFLLTPEDEGLPNLVPLFESSDEGKEALKKLVTSCYDEFIQSWEKNDSYRKKVAESWRLLYCDLPAKNKPFEHCANTAIPLALQNVVRYTNKIYSEIFGDWSNVFNFVPTNPQAELIAPIVSEHSNWQLRNRIVGFKRQQHRGLLIFAVAGDVVCHSYYDPVTRRNCHEILTCDDFVTPYTHVSVSPDFSDVPWVARRIPFFKTKLKAMSSQWSNVEEVLKHSAPEYGDTGVETELRQAIAEHLGEEPFGQIRGEYEIIHYEGWLKLLGQDKERYCQLIFDLTTKTPLKLSIHETADYAERYRYDYQMKEFTEYGQQIQQLQMLQQQQQMQTEQAFQMAAAEPIGSPNAPMMADQGRQMMQQPLPEPPPPPSWMKDNEPPEPPRKEPIYMFSHGVCLEPMLGNLGIGIGRIDAQLNLATNTVWSQFLDAATLGNGKTFITASNVDFRSPFKIGPGVFNKAKNVMPSDLQNAFYELDFGQANPQLIQAADKLMQFGEQASSTPDIMSGAAGKSGETARGIQERIGQMNAMFGVPTMKYADFVIQIMRNNCKLNRVYMDDSEIFYVNRFNESLEMQGSEMIKAAREMYDNEYDIELVGDLQFKSRAQKVSEADEITQMVNAIPQLQGNMALLYKSISESLKARGMHRMAKELLGPPPPLPQNTFGLPPGVPGSYLSMDNAANLPPEQQQMLMQMQQQQAQAAAQQEQNPEQQPEQNGPPNA